MNEETRFAYGRNRAFAAISGVSWGAVIAGVVLALMIQLMLAVLGVGIGASTINPQTEQSPMSGLGIGSAIWLVLSGIIAMYVGGWVAGRLSGVTRRSDGGLHGAVTWAVAGLVTIYFLTSTAGSLIAGTAGLLGRMVSTTGQVTASSPELSEEAKRVLKEQGIDINSIKQQAKNPQTQQQAEQQTRQAGEKIAGGISVAGIFTFCALILGLIAAAVGGSNGVPYEPRPAAPPAERAA
jgi:hypothetical protein